MVENVDEFPPLKYVSDISTTRQIDDQLSDNQVDTNKGVCTSDIFIEQNDELLGEIFDKLIDEQIDVQLAEIMTNLCHWRPSV